MNLATKSVAHWAVDLVTALVIVVLIVFMLDSSVDATTFRWPALYGNFLVVLSTFLVATISFRTELAEQDKDAKIATSLFTFANSVAALVPLLVELFKSNPARVSSKLRESVVFELFYETDAAEITVYATVLFLVLIAFCFAWYAAGQIAHRRGTVWFASTASILILSVQLLLISPWQSAELKADPSSLLVVVFLLLIVYSGLVASLLHRLPLAAGSLIEIVRGGITAFVRNIWTLTAAIALRSLWLLFTIPAYFFFELFILSATAPAAQVFLHAIGALAQWSLVAFSVLTASAAALLVLASIWSVLARLPRMYREAAASTRVLLRNSGILIAVILGLLLVWPLLGSEVDDEEPSIVVEEPEPVEEVLYAEDIIYAEAAVVCDSQYFGFGWEYASSSELTIPINACELKNRREALTSGAILVLGAASTESQASVETENSRAKDRGFGLARVLMRQQSSIMDPAAIYVLNLGMDLTGAVGLPREIQDARYDRPTTIVRFSTVPKDATPKDGQLERAIFQYISENFNSVEHAVCDLYKLQNLDDIPTEPINRDLCGG